MKPNPKKVQIDIFVIYGLSVCIIVVVSLVNFIKHHTVAEKKESQKQVQVAQAALFDKRAFTGVKVEGKAYIVYDIVTQEIIASKNETEPLPLASITKVMTAVSAVLHKSKDDKVTITPKSIEDGYDLGLKNNQVWKLSELLKYTLVFSSNDGAEVVADSFGGKEIFIKQMNEDAKVLSLDLHFTDPAGRDIAGNIGGKGTVLEAAKLFAVARRNIPDILDATTKKRENVISSTGRISGVPNTNQAIESLPGAEASKTGYTDMAGGNLGVVVDISLGHPVVIVVLGSTKEGRFRDMSILYNTLRKSLGSGIVQ
jgi:D-alanyl-D-alanine carboxypeptidase